MLYVTETSKDVETAARDLEEAVKRNKFGVLHVHNLKQTLKEKGIDFPNACKILEVCNPQQANKVLTQNMAVSMALPCRISVYEEVAQQRHFEEVGVVAARRLSAALENVAGDGARGEPVPIGLAPAELVDHRAECDGGVGHASREHDLSA